MRSFVLAFCVVATTATARAQDFDAAAKHFGAAQEAFAAKHYKVAANEFQTAFDTTHDPILLYNIAESWEKAGDGKKAAASYRAYLKAQPNAGDKAEVQRRLKAIEAKKFKLASQSAPGDELPAATTATAPPAATPEIPPPATAPTPAGAPAAPSTAPPPVAAPPIGDNKTLPPSFDAPPPAAPAPEPARVETPPPPAAPPAAVVGDADRPSRLRVAAWVGVASTVAVLTAGAILGLAAQSRADEVDRRYNFVDANGAPKKFDQSQADDLHNLVSDGQLYNGLAIGFFSAAGALAVATTVMFVLDWKHAREKREGGPHALRLAPTVDRHGGGIAAGWSF